MTERNPLVLSGEYERVFAAELAVGDKLAAFDDRPVVYVSRSGDKHVYIGVGDSNMAYRPDAKLLVRTKR